MGKIEQSGRELILLAIRVYRYLISPYLPRSCRFWPTCSDYTMQAIEQHGCLRGSWLGIKRISKCHPWHAGGIDQVPPCTDDRFSDYQGRPQ